MSNDFHFSLDEDTQFTQILNTQGLVLHDTLKHLHCTQRGYFATLTAVQHFDIFCLKEVRHYIFELFFWQWGLLIGRKPLNNSLPG